MFDRKVKKDMRLYGSKILDSKEFHEALQQKHHMRASVGRHSIRVTEASLRMSYALEKLGVKTDRESLVVGGLCHDLGMLGRKEKYKNASETCRQHPRDSVEMARRMRPYVDGYYIITPFGRTGLVGRIMDEIRKIET